MGADAVTPVGFIGWHHQPVDGGVGWGISVVRTPGYEERRRSVPLMAAMQAIQDHDSAPPHPRPWTADESGGFHYVAMYPGALAHDGIAHVTAMEQQLGRPFYCDWVVVVWAVPGVGEVPPPYRGVPASKEDPCTR